MVEGEPLGSTWLPTEPFPPGLQRPLCGSIQALGFARAAVEKARSEVYPGHGELSKREVGGGWTTNHSVLAFSPSSAFGVFQVILD